MKIPHLDHNFHLILILILKNQYPLFFVTDALPSAILYINYYMSI